MLLAMHLPMQLGTLYNLTESYHPSWWSVDYPLMASVYCVNRMLSCSPIGSLCPRLPWHLVGSPHHCCRSDGVILLQSSFAWKLLFQYSEGVNDSSVGSWGVRSNVNHSLFANPSWSVRVALSSHSVVMLGKRKYGV